MTDALALACRRAVHVITPEGTTLAAGRAALYVLDRIGWRRLAALFSTRPLLWCVEVLYGLVARHRRLLGRFLSRRE